MKKTDVVKWIAPFDLQCELFLDANTPTLKNQKMGWNPIFCIYHHQTLGVKCCVTRFLAGQTWSIKHHQIAITLPALFMAFQLVANLHLIWQKQKSESPLFYPRGVMSLEIAQFRIYFTSKRPHPEMIKNRQWWYLCQYQNMGWVYWVQRGIIHQWLCQFSMTLPYTLRAGISKRDVTRRRFFVPHRNKNQ